MADDSNEYDIEHPPTAEEWLAMDEGERLALVRAAHARSRARVGSNAAAHAAFHVMVENRLAEGHAVVVKAYERFRAAGVNRHNTVHALASVATQHVMAVLQKQPGFNQEDADRDYEALDPTAFMRPK